MIILTELNVLLQETLFKSWLTPSGKKLSQHSSLETSFLKNIRPKWLFYLSIHPLSKVPRELKMGLHIIFQQIILFDDREAQQSQNKI